MADLKNVSAQQGVDDTTRGHFLALDALRGIAASLVAIGHLGWTTTISTTPLVHNAYLMVDFFFVLSGFVIALNYSGRISDARQLGRFVWLRFWRLYPLHLVMLLVFVGIEGMKWFAAHRSGIVSTSPPFSTNNGLAFLTNLFLVQSFGMNPDDTFNAPAWSISTEFYTYLVFALATLAAGRRILIVAPLLMLASGSLLAHAGGGLSLSHTIEAFARCVFGFFLGVIVHALYKRWQPFAEKRVAAIAAAIAMLSLVTLLCVKTDERYDILAPVFSAFIILGLSLSRNSLTSRALSTRPMIWLGAASYSIYMVHMAVVWTLDQVVRVGLHAQIVPTGQWSARLLAVSPLLGDVLALAALMATLLVSHFTFTRIEVPFRDWSKNAWPKKRA
jgi:peptidoglycan/LPS O-acetylase OafA/YrhL